MNSTDTPTPGQGAAPGAPSTRQQKEWRNFGWQLGLVITGACGLLLWRGVISPRAFGIGCAVALALALVGFIWPALLRRPYALSLAVSRFIGTRFGGLVLYVFYFVVITPLGCVARAFGYDPLWLGAKRRAASYWRPAPPATPLERLY